jgi:hypothetical protein
MLSRLYPDPSTEEEKAEMGKLMRAVAHNYPDVLPEMQLNVRQSVAPPQNTDWREHKGRPMPISLQGPLVNVAVENFSRKLFCALYYKHAEQILCPEGGIAALVDKPAG